MITIILATIQIIALLILMRTLQENTIEMKKQNIEISTIKSTNQRTIIIFLLIEILVILSLSNYTNISDMLHKLLSQAGIQ